MEKKTIIKKPSVAVILVNWNGEDDTVDCVESLKNVTYPNFKVIISDNGSEEKSLEKIRPLASEMVEVMENNANLGFSGGNNVAMEKALKEGYDYCMLLNNDTTVEPDFLDKLVDVAESDEKIGAVGSKIYFYFEPDKGKVWYGGGKFSWIFGGSHMQYEHVDEDHPHDTKPREVDYITGCTFLVKAKVLREVGLLFEDFFLYYEDTDWSMRIQKAGYKTIHAPFSKVYHKVSRSSEKLGNPKIYYYHVRNALLLSKRNAPWYIRPGVYVWSVWQYFKQIIKYIFFPKGKIKL